MEKLIRLLPDDEPELFYKKLLYMSNECIEKDKKRFDKLAKYRDIINCHLRLKKKPEYNIKVVYNQNGWHLTLCDDSHADYKPVVGDPKTPCNCTTFINNPDKLFTTLEREPHARCSLCKRWVAEWSTNVLNPTIVKEEPFIEKKWVPTTKRIETSTTQPHTTITIE